MVTSTNSLSLDLEWPADPSATNPEELFAAGYSACFNGKCQRAWIRRRRVVSTRPETARLGRRGAAADAAECGRGAQGHLGAGRVRPGQGGGCAAALLPLPAPPPPPPAQSTVSHACLRPGGVGLAARVNVTGKPQTDAWLAKVVGSGQELSAWCVPQWRAWMTRRRRSMRPRRTTSARTPRPSLATLTCRLRRPALAERLWRRGGR